jgi:hypothetical protein
MGQSVISKSHEASKFKRWLLEGHVKEMEGPHEPEHQHAQHSWPKVMCLTGVDYFSTLGYQPGIAALAAGSLAPIATLVLVLLTLFGALPMYHRVAAASPHGDGSISMLERLLSWWQGKLLVLCLLGFAATSFIITITLSAADAAMHIIENPFAPHWMDHPVMLSLVLVALLAAVFLKGFKEAINIAVVLVVAYIALNLVVVATGIMHIVREPARLGNWYSALFVSHDNILLIIAAALLLFPKLALGLSGFETGVVVMPLVKGDPSDTQENLDGRIRNTRKLLTAAALIMSVLLISSSFVTTLLIEPHEFEEGGLASGRALAYLAHEFLGEGFGTAYDLSTIAILWFAGSSAMAGLLNIVPRYLPRYGMAPDWARATRPLVLIFTAICAVVTLAFNADVEAQGGAYATGVLTLMGSAAVAVTLAAYRRRQKLGTLAFGVITSIFLYTIAVNVLERPDGIKIAGLFILAIVITSMISRIWRTTELRIQRIELDETARQLIGEATKGTIRIIANKRQDGNEKEYHLKEKDIREDNLIPKDAPVLFFEVNIDDPSDFNDVLKITGKRVGRYSVLRTQSPAVPNAIAAFLLHLKNEKQKIPHCYFTWSEGNPIKFLLRYVIFGEGDTAPVTREILRREVPDPEQRPMIHVG